MPVTTRLAPTSLPRALAAAAVVALACAGAGAPGREGGGVAPAASPLDVTRAFYAALHGGDAQGAAKLVGSPRALSATESFVKLALAYRDLELAVRERFGPDAARTVGYADRIAAEDEALRRATAQVKGDDATIRANGETLALLRRMDGAWRIQLEDAFATESGMAGLVREAEASTEAAARVAPAIRQGLFDGPEDALEAFRNEVSLRMEGAQSDLPGPPQPRPGEIGL